MQSCVSGPDGEADKETGWASLKAAERRVHKGPGSRNPGCLTHTGSVRASFRQRCHLSPILEDDRGYPGEERRGEGRGKGREGDPSQRGLFGDWHTRPGTKVLPEAKGTQGGGLLRACA